MNNVKLETRRYTIPTDILDDLLTRFVLFVPESVKENLIRICFQIELAHWFYLDFYVVNDKRLSTCTIHEFAAHVFQYVPFLQKDSHRLTQVIRHWIEYKRRLPTYGAIIISENMSHVLLVQSNWETVSWGFPKGKINENEDPARCAIREVLEETGFDISNHINPNEYLQSVINVQRVRLYIIKNIPLSTQFCPKTRCEIKSCSWFAVSDLPTSKHDRISSAKLGINPHSFFLAIPFVQRLKQICAMEHKRNRHSVSSSEKKCINSTRQNLPKAQSRTTRKRSRRNRTNNSTRERNCSQKKEITGPSTSQHLGPTSNSMDSLSRHNRAAPQNKTLRYD